MDSKQENIMRVLAALEISEFPWRTARGLAAETGLDESLVRTILLSNGDLIERSPECNKNGEQLFASRRDRTIVNKSARRLRLI